MLTTRKHTAKVLRRKRNTPRIIYAILTLLLIVLASSYMDLRRDSKALEYRMIETSQRSLEQEQLLNERYDQLKKLQGAVESSEKAKTDVQAQLDEKARIEAEKQSEIDRLKSENKRLQSAKAAKPKVAVSITSGGRGGLDSRATNSVAGNGYDYGYCTWYVKNRRPDIPNSWGNANRWYANAQASGYATGPKPRAGAIGTTTAGSLGHVVYIESVNADGTVTVAEMNYTGWNVVSRRTTTASEFSYIY